MSIDVDSRTEDSPRPPRNSSGSAALWGLATLLTVFGTALGAYQALFPFDTARAKVTGLVLMLLLAASAARAAYVVKSGRDLDVAFVGLIVALVAGIAVAVVNTAKNDHESRTAVAQILSPHDGHVTTTGTGHPTQDVKVQVPDRDGGRWYVAVISSTQNDIAYVHPVHASGSAGATVTVGIGPPGDRGKGTYHIQLLFLSSARITQFNVPDRKDGEIPSTALSGIKVEDEVDITR